MNDVLSIIGDKTRGVFIYHHIDFRQLTSESYGCASEAQPIGQQSVAYKLAILTKPRNSQYQALALALALALKKRILTMHMNFFKAVALGSTLIISSCGGGDSDATTESASTNSSQVTVNSGNLNPDLPGKFMFSFNWANHATASDRRRDGGLLMDIRSGTYTEIPNSHWVEIFEQWGYEGVSRPIALPIPGDGSSFYVQTDNQFESDDGINQYFLTMHQSTSGDILAQHLRFRLFGDSDLAISFDKSFVAFFANDYFRIVQVTPSANPAVDKKPHPKRPYAWLPDNRLVLVSKDRRSFEITRQQAVSGDVVLLLPESVGGEIREVSASPSGDQLAFILQENNSIDTPWIINLDGTNLRKLATTSDSGDFQNYGEIQWSPDGNFVMVTEPSVGFFDAAATSLPSSRYVLPVNETTELLQTSVDPTRRSNGVIRLNFCGDPSNEQCNVQSDVIPDVYWIP